MNFPNDEVRVNRGKTLKIQSTPVLVNKKLETYKLVFDLMKHLTTLSSGSILILIALIEKIFRTTPSTPLLAFSFGGFCFSIIFAIVAMMLLAFTAADGMLTEGEKNVFAISATLSAVFFGGQYALL
jgi:hypothetical protein